jgi:outer membrane lipoprotein-sorting protein
MRRFPTFALASSLALLALCPLAGQADEKGEALLRDVAQATKQAKSLSADIKSLYRFGERDMKMSGKMHVQRPNLAYIDIEGEPMNQKIVSTGKEMFIVLKAQKQYLKQPTSANGANVRGGFFAGSLFFSTDLKQMLGRYVGKPTVSLDLKDEEERDGVKYRVLAAASEDGKNRLKLYVGESNLILGVVVDQAVQDQSLHLEEFLSDVKVDPKLDAKLFAFTPPAGFKPYEPPRYDEKLLKVGVEAPAFELTKPSDKSKISLAKMLDGRKAVLVNFWFYG